MHLPTQATAVTALALAAVASASAIPQPGAEAEANAHPAPTAAPTAAPMLHARDDPRCRTQTAADANFPNYDNYCNPVTSTGTKTFFTNAPVSTYVTRHGANAPKETVTVFSQKVASTQVAVCTKIGYNGVVWTEIDQNGNQVGEVGKCPWYSGFAIGGGSRTSIGCSVM